MLDPTGQLLQCLRDSDQEWEFQVLNRRHFLLGSCCALHALSTRTANAQTQGFLCQTVDPADPRTGVVTVPFSSSSDEAAKIDLQAAASAVSQFEFNPFGVALLKHRWRKEDSLIQTTSGPITLGVRFLNGSESAKALVRQHVPRWTSGSLSQKLAFQFEDLPVQRAHIRVAFDAGEGNFSTVGRAARLVKSTEKTMNLENLTQRVILHEFGHALGLQHEHHHPQFGFRWNEDTVIADMAQIGWTPARQGAAERQGTGQRLSDH